MGRLILKYIYEYKGLHTTTYYVEGWSAKVCAQNHNARDSFFLASTNFLYGMGVQIQKGGAL